MKQHLNRRLRPVLSIDFHDSTRRCKVQDYVAKDRGFGAEPEKLCSGPRDRVATHPIRNWELLREWVPRSA